MAFVLSGKVMLTIMQVCKQGNRPFLNYRRTTNLKDQIYIFEAVVLGC